MKWPRGSGISRTARSKTSRARTRSTSPTRRSCSGFVVNPDGYIATAGHCVDVGPEGFRDDYIQHAAAEANTNRPSVSVDDFYQFGSMNWTVEGQTKGSPIDLQVLVHLGGDPNSEPLPARVVDYRSLGQGDVALLKVEAHDLPSSQLVTDQDVRIGDQVLSVGYPASTDLVTDQSAEPSNKEGAISSKKTQGSVPVYEISAAVSPGMSGGPTVSTDGRVMGVNSSTIRGESQPFNFIAPASNLAELMKRNGVESTLAPVDRSTATGSPPSTPGATPRRSPTSTRPPRSRRGMRARRR